VGNIGLRTVLRRIAIGFNASDWTNNTLTVLQSGVPTQPGEIGPHNFSTALNYDTVVHRYLGPSQSVEVALTVVQDRNTGNISLIKAAIVPSFTGIALIQAY
jgi:hypothetical protein